MDKLQVIDTQNLRGKIHTIRGFQVMIDRDLAELYEVKTIRLREQVKRNIDRFPDDFMFQLSDDEVDFMVSQNAIPSRKHLGGSLPYVFTEHCSTVAKFAIVRFEVLEILGRLKFDEVK